MTTKAVKALIWKEYRQHVTLLAAMIIMCVLFQIVMFAWFHWIMDSLREIADLDYMVLCSYAFVVFYAIACSSILFAKEKEDKTDNFLRNMPISGATVLVGKLLWLFGSMTALAVAMTFVTFVWWMILGSPQANAEDFWSGVGWLSFYCFSGTCLGLFWSSITRKQLHAIVGTLASMIVLALLVALIVFQITMPDQTMYGVLLCGLYLFACTVLGGIGIRNGGKWLRKREDKTIGAKIDALQNKQWRHKNVTIERLRAQKQPRGEFRWLLWQCYRQSSLLFKLGLALPLMLLIWPMLEFFVTFERLKMLFRFLLTASSCIGGYVICCNVFYPDHEKNGIMVLSYRGISPGKVWWSRIVMFGSLLFFCLAALVGSQLLNERLGMPIEGFNADAAFGCTVFFLCTFVVGQFASIISRSLILPMLYTGIFLFLGFWWGIYVIYVNEIAGSATIFFDLWPIVLVFLPIVLSFFVASRLRMSDWMRDRPLRASWRKLALTFGGGLVVSVALIACIRLSTVPTASLGYKLDPWVLKQNIDYEANNLRFVELQNSLEGSNDIADYITVRRELKAMNENPLLSPGTSYFFDGAVYSQISQQIMQPDVTPEFLRDAIAFLEELPNDRVSATTIVQRHYENVMQEIRSGKLSPLYYKENPQLAKMVSYGRMITPWEKMRALRFAEYRFQTDSLVAAQSERLVLHNEGDIQYLSAKIGVLKITAPNYSLYSDGFYGLSVTPYSIYLLEQGRRLAILKAALRLWYDEHGELPETLDQLKDVYLAEVPLVPFYNTPFKYCPHPEEDDTADTQTPTHVKGTPYLAVQLDDTFPTDYALINNSQKLIFDLKFANLKNEGANP